MEVAVATTWRTVMVLIMVEVEVVVLSAAIATKGSSIAAVRVERRIVRLGVNRSSAQIYPTLILQEIPVLYPSYAIVAIDQMQQAVR